MKFLFIFQVKNNFRSSITIPEKSWVKFRDIFTEYVDKIRESSEEKVPGGGANGGSGTQGPLTTGVEVNVSGGGNALSTTTSK